MPNEPSSDTLMNVLPKITVFGIGGAGINAVNNMVISQLEGVKFVTANTDCQSLMNSLAETKIQLGAKCTKGLGAGSNPEIGKQAAEEASDAIKRELADTDMLFIATGMGGGTGTGASPVVAKIAKDMGILTIAIAMKPFFLEGKKRMDKANKGIAEIEKYVDTLIVIENQKLMTLNNISMIENYAVADGILRQAVYCVVSILVKQGFINRDFADIKTVLSSMGRAVIGYGEDIDPKVATDIAIHNPVLENCSINGAKNILVNITGNKSIKPSDIEEIVDKIRDEAETDDNEDPNIIFGIVFDESIGNNIRVSIIAAGVEKQQSRLANNMQNNNIQDTKSTLHIVENSSEKLQNDTQNIESAKTSSPVFASEINEDDILSEYDNILQTEEIPTANNDEQNFQETFFQLAGRKANNQSNTAKNNSQKAKNIEHTTEKQWNNLDKNNKQNADENFDLFNNPPMQQKSKGFLSRFISSIGNAPFVEANDKEDLSSITQDSNIEDSEIYNMPAIKRKVS